MTEEMKLEATPPPKKKRAKAVRKRKKKTTTAASTAEPAPAAEMTPNASTAAEAKQVDVGQVDVGKAIIGIAASTDEAAPKAAETKSKTTRSGRKRTTKAKRRPAKKPAATEATEQESQAKLPDAPETAKDGGPTKRQSEAEENPRAPMPAVAEPVQESTASLPLGESAPPQGDSESPPKRARPARKRGGAASRRRKAKDASAAAQAEQEAGQPSALGETGSPKPDGDQPRSIARAPKSTSAEAATVDVEDHSPRRDDRKPDTDAPTADATDKPTDGKPGRRSRGQRGARRGGRRPTRNREADAESVEVDMGEGESVPTPTGQSTMLINVSAGDECRIAVVKQGRLEELFIERSASQSRVGNIYKGTVMNVEPSIQAAFIDFGIMKNGFLHISDVQPQYFPSYNGEPEDVGRKIPRRDRPPIQECFQRGQEVIVQVIKEGVGTKGPTLTTYLSVPGRFLVMMPGMSRHGVSRKIEDEDTRRAMRDMLRDMELPQGIGFILRTAGLGQSKRELQRDLKYLLRLWKQVVDRVKRLDAPAELYEESDLVTRTLRDVYSPDFNRIVVDDVDAARRAREFLKIAMPRSKVELELYSDREPLFHRFGIEDELEDINKRTVPLKSGGSLVIDTTEALVAIDVNSGKFRTPDDAEELAFQVDMEAAVEIARQLRLRDLGGLIVCDFIDMRLDRHKRAVERALRDALKSHKERARILRMSAFGLIEMTRQRRGPSIKRNTFFECNQCKGTGLVKMPESVVLDVMRVIQLAANKDRAQRITVTVSSSVAFQILNRKRSVINSIETETGKEILVLGDPGFTSDQVEYTCEDARGNVIPLTRVGASDRRGRRRPR